MTPNDAADAIPDVARDEAGEKLAAVRTLGAGSPVLAFDVGGTDIKSALFDADGRALGLRRTPTPTADGDRTPALLDRLEVLAAQLRDEHPDVVPRAAGLVVPGIVDAAAGIGVFASNMGWRDAPLRALAAERLGLPVAFDHDVRAASWAEHELGGARAYDDAVILVIGTGIAGALLVGGRPYTAGGYGGEIGHSPIADGPVCPWLSGGRGLGGRHRAPLPGGHGVDPGRRQGRHRPGGRRGSGRRRHLGLGAGRAHPVARAADRRGRP